MKLSKLSSLVSLVAAVSAIHIPFERRETGIARQGLQTRRNAILRRQSPANDSDTDPFHFENLSDLLYVGTVVIDGQSFQVQLDSGSSDLWVDSTGITFSTAQNTHITGTIAYLDTTSATGDILLANVTFGNWTAPSQAFISAVGTNATTLGDKGLLGVGPPGLSNVAETLASSNFNGNSFLDNVFDAYPNDPNMISFLLSRNDQGTTDGGSFTIGTAVPGYESVLSNPKLDVYEPQGSQWVTLMDGITINGQEYSGGSEYVNGDQLTVLLDSGTSLGTAIKSYVDVMYGGIPNSQWSEEDATYLFPCDSVVNISMNFGNQVIFLHPIDLSYPYGTTNDGTAYCAGSYSVNDGSGLDFILGDSFLRNVYSVFDFAGWTNSGEGNPFMQIQGITDPTKAFAEFSSLNAQRVQAAFSSGGSGGGNSSSGTGAEAVSGAISDSDSGSVDLNAVKRNEYIIMGMIGIAIILLILNVVVSNRKNSGYRQLGAHGSAPPAHYADKGYSTPYDS